MNTLISIGSVDTTVAFTNDSTYHMATFLEGDGTIPTSLSYCGNDVWIGITDRMDPSSVLYFLSMIRKEYKTQYELFQFFLPSTKIVDGSPQILFHADNKSRLIQDILSNYIDTLYQKIKKETSKMGMIYISVPGILNKEEADTFVYSVRGNKALSSAKFVDEPLMIVKSALGAEYQKSEKYIVIAIDAFFCYISEVTEFRTFPRVGIHHTSPYGSLFGFYRTILLNLLLEKKCKVDDITGCKMMQSLEEALRKYARTGRADFSMNGIPITLDDNTVERLTGNFFQKFQENLLENCEEIRGRIHRIIFTGEGTMYKIFVEKMKDVVKGIAPVVVTPAIQSVNLVTLHGMIRHVLPSVEIRPPQQNGTNEDGMVEDESEDDEELDEEMDVMIYNPTIETQSVVQLPLPPISPISDMQEKVATLSSSPSMVIASISYIESSIPSVPSVPSTGK